MKSNPHPSGRVPGGQPVLAMSSLGRLGRFGNQVMQYFFLRICAEKSGARIQCPPWLGNRLFGFQDGPVTCRLPLAIERWEAGANMFDQLPELIPYLEKMTGATGTRIGVEALERGLSDVDLWGHFQYHTRHYRPHRNAFQALFQPAPALKADLDAALARLRANGRTLIAIHLRCGDFRRLPHFGFTLCVPARWWCDWLDGVWGQFERPILFLCSDDLKPLLPQFDKYRAMASRDLGLQWGESRPELVDYIDFYVLSQADVVGISNSSFSFVASMMNERGRLFVRPHWDFTTRFSAFNPWDSQPLLYPGGSSPRLYKTCREAMRAAYATGGCSEMARCIFIYAWGRAALKANRMAWAAQADGVKGVLKTVIRSSLRSQG
jgi:hypothetical protein